MIIGSGLVPIIGRQMDEVLMKCSLPPLSAGAMIYFAIISLLLGVCIVGLYALIKPQFKSKKKAIIIISILIWYLYYICPNFALVAYGIMPFKLAAIGTAWGLLELLPSAVAGAKLYKEK